MKTLSKSIIACLLICLCLIPLVSCGSTPSGKYVCSTEVGLSEVEITMYFKGDRIFFEEKIDDKLEKSISTKKSDASYEITENDDGTQSIHCAFSVYGQGYSPNLFKYKMTYEKNGDTIKIGKYEFKKK